LYKHGVSILLCVFVFAAGTVSVYGQEDYSDVYGKANKSVVLIDFEDGAREVGSGVIIGITRGGSALILTAHHVVNGYEEVIVSFSGIIEPYAGIVSDTFYDDAEDLAIVIVREPPQDMKVINFKKASAKKGESVGTIGHPLGEAFTWSGGSITNMHGKYLIHNAYLERGSSGGPLLDGCSRMLGMNVQLIQFPDEEKELYQDTLEGGSVALAASSIVSIMEGWFSDTRFEEKWGVKKYCSFWERLYKDPVFLVVELGTIVGGIIWQVKKNNGDDGEVKIFGEPPPPPSN
jgi:S1-C subfamily serine protease